MRIILAELKKRGLFFLDSRTTPNSVVPNVAREIGIKHAVRDVFLDLGEGKSELYVRKQIEKLAAVAVQKKRAIGIGHNKMATLKAIKDSIPYLEKQGIEIVPLKELVK